ncbi:tyrosine-type recombinase/integrase [Sorangium sp. So ce693]|uniref:tyrosine-type recombinase/integrase n=1 Tax=Sorangium sp. So ce693 TaxID=3133318 RepID=UPI003F62E4E6
MTSLRSNAAPRHPRRTKRGARSSSFTSGFSTCRYPGSKRSNAHAGRSTSPRSSRGRRRSPCSNTSSRLIGELLHGSGLRLLEAPSIRVNHVDLDRRQIMVRRGKGQHDRPALLPARARDELHAQLDSVARRHEKELAAGRSEIDLPHALRGKMPGAATSLTRQYLFPVSRPCTDPATDRQVLYHLHESAAQRAVHDAGR